MTGGLHIYLLSYVGILLSIRWPRLGYGIVIGLIVDRLLPGDSLGIKEVLQILPS